MSPPVWLITAASSGFGKAIALEALARGHKVYATGRSRSRLAELEKAGASTCDLDVAWDLPQISKVVDSIAKESGHIDILVNAAGYILEGAIEETS